MRSKFTITFDMDGVLIDSRKALLKSYHAAGVDPPPNFLSLSWREWLDDSAIHTRKNELYPQYIKQYGKPLSGYDALKTLYDRGYPIIVLTKASFKGACAVKEFLNLQHVRFITDCTDDRDKIIWLQRTRTTVYIDDRADAVFIANAAPCKFIHYFPEIPLNYLLRECTNVAYRKH